MHYIKKFLSEYTSFRITETNEKETIIIGNLEVSLEYKGINIYKEIPLKIKLNKNYPISLPKVYDIKNILLKNFHKNPDNSLCLGTELEIRKELFNDYSLKNWIKKCVEPFIFSSVCFEKYEILIFGEREHGVIGEMSSLKEYFDFGSLRETYLFLKFIFLRKYRRKLFKKKSKIKKITSPCGHKSMFKCSYFLKLKELNLYFNNNVLMFLDRIILEFEREVKINVKYKN